jgi:NADPH:quinone reductase
MLGVLVKDFGGPEVLTTTQIPLPEFGLDDVLIQVHAIGVNPVDTYIRSGQYKNLPILPYVPGKDGAGTVYRVGENVKSLKVGQRVYFLGSTSGSSAQYATCPAKYVFQLPQNLTFIQGACLGTPAFTAYRALFEKGHITPGERLFIHGASGGVGLVAIEMAKAIGIEVVGTAGTLDGIQVLFSKILHLQLLIRLSSMLELLMSSTIVNQTISKTSKPNIPWVSMFVLKCWHQPILELT